MMIGDDQRLTPDLGMGLEIPEPRLARFEATDDRMPGGVEVPGRVLDGRGVAASDVTAFGTAA